MENFLGHVLQDVGIRSRYPPDILQTNVEQKFLMANSDECNLKNILKPPFLLGELNCCGDQNVIYSRVLSGQFPLDADSSAVDLLISDGNYKTDMTNKLKEYKNLLIEREIFYSNSLKEKKQKLQDRLTKIKLGDAYDFKGDFLHSPITRKEQLDEIQEILENRIKEQLKAQGKAEQYFSGWKETMISNITETKQHISNTKDAYGKLMMKFEQVKKEAEVQYNLLHDLNEVRHSISSSILDVHERYLILKSSAEEQLEKANVEFKKVNEETEPLDVLHFDVKRKLLTVSRLENEVKIKTKEGEALQKLQEELLRSSV